MEKNILLFVAFLLTNTSIAQFGSKQIIDDEGGVRIITFDLDGDGDQDILKAGSGNLAWYENIDGQGNFSTKIIIDGDDEWKSAKADDIDGDGDLDIVASSLESAKLEDIIKIAWFENTDGQGDFGPKQIFFINNNFYSITSVFIGDIDGDGDNDVVSGSSEDLFWFENLDGLGYFSEMNIIVSGDLFIDLFIHDFDGDEDIDVLASTRQSEEIIWYENTNGLGNFDTQHIVANTMGKAVSIYVSNLDEDEFKDIINITSDPPTLSWYKNMDGLGNFGQQQIISNLNHSGRKVLARDIDNDGDMDVLTATQESAFGIGTMAWYENIDGQGNFGEQQIIHQEENFGFTLFASDLDGDNDIDVIGTSYFSEVAWFENIMPLSIVDNEVLKQIIYPNPAQNIINIENSEDVISIRVYDVLGRLLLEKNNDFENINVSFFERGILIVSLKTSKGSFIDKILKE